MIGVERVGDVTTIELQRPERRNALNSELVDSLREAVETAAAEDVRVIVITGQGTVFCAGADLSGDVFAADFPDKAIALNMAIDAAPMPVIAALNGPAIGAGVQLAMVCDLRVVSPEAYFQFPIAKYGLALDNWSIRRLASRVGHGRARAMLLAAERLDAQTALMTGMANRLGTLADDDFDRIGLAQVIRIHAVARGQVLVDEVLGLATLFRRHAAIARRRGGARHRSAATQGFLGLG